MRPLLIPFVIAAALLSTGCSIKQNVTPVTFSADISPEICLIPAEGLRAGFNSKYEALLREKGFQTRQIPSGSSPSSCPLSTTYVGTWRWDMALYMSYADIRVYQHGRQVGQAEYDSRSGSGRMDKFINAENKIAELTNQLFPNGAAGLLGKGAVDSRSVEGPLSREAYRQQQLDHLTSENLPYDEYQKRYGEIMKE